MVGLVCEVWFVRFGLVCLFWFYSSDTCSKLLPALTLPMTAVTGCWQLHLNFITTSTLLKYLNLIPSLRVNSLSPAVTAVTAVASFAS